MISIKKDFKERDFSMQKLRQLRSHIHKIAKQNQQQIACMPKQQQLHLQISHIPKTVIRQSLITVHMNQTIKCVLRKTCTPTAEVQQQLQTNHRSNAAIQPQLQRNHSPKNVIQQQLQRRHMPKINIKSWRKMIT